MEGKLIGTKPVKRVLAGEDLQHEAWVSFLTAFRAVSRTRYAELHKAGFHKLHAGLLQLLYANGGSLTVSQIADMMYLVNHSVTGLTNRAEKLGLIRRVNDDDDHRLVHIVITEEGERECQRSLKYRHNVRLIMGALTTKELEEFIYYLKVVRERALAEEVVTGG